MKKKYSLIFFVALLIIVLFSYLSLASLQNISLAPLQSVGFPCDSCSDTDNGLNYSIKGMVHGCTSACPVFAGISANRNPGCKTYYSYNDTCVDGNTLREYYCLNKRHKSELHTCPDVCEDGKCEKVNGTVYVVYAIDTETKGLNVEGVFNQSLDFSPFGPEGSVSDVMREYWRDGLRDSFGNHIKLTWFLMTAEPYCHSTNSDCNAIYTAIEDWSDEVEYFGDDLELHYHHFEWSDPNGDGIYHWNQLLEFNESNQGLFEKMLNHFLIDKNFFPSSYKTGWGWEDNGLSNFLEEVIQFDLSNLARLPGTGGNASVFPNTTNTTNTTTEPIANIYNWSLALNNWTAYHPNVTNYQLPGDMKRIIQKCRGVLYQGDLDTAFRAASEGENIVLCYHSHTYTSLWNKPQNMHDTILNASNTFGINFSYVTADEALRGILKIEDTSPPTVTITRNGDFLIINSNEEIFQQKPYATIKYENGIYERVYPEENGVNSWKFNTSSIEGGFIFGIGLSDNAGNTATAFYNSS